MRNSDRAKTAPTIRRAIIALSGGRRLRRPAPARLWKDVRLDHAILVSLDRGEHRLDQRLGEKVWLQPEIEELGVLRVVVMLFLLHAWVLHVFELHVEPVLLAGPLHELGELHHRE